MSSTLRVEDIYVSPEEYLAAERVSETKHEYLAGVIYARAGGTRRHGRITNNIIITLDAQFTGTRCFPYGPDVRLRIRGEGGTFLYYPDVTVDCSESRLDEIETPSAIFEVLSPSTERADRGDKLLNYQGIPALRVYAILEQERPIVTIYRRVESGAWAIELYSNLEQVIALPELPAELSIAAIYRDIFPAGAFT
jgi:Uma2 family endonuclease